MKVLFFCLLAGAALGLAHGPDHIYNKVKTRQIKHQQARREAAKHINDAALQKRQTSKFLNANSQRMDQSCTSPSLKLNILQNLSLMVRLCLKYHSILASRMPDCFPFPVLRMRRGSYSFGFSPLAIPQLQMRSAYGRRLITPY